MGHETSRLGRALGEGRPAAAAGAKARQEGRAEGDRLEPTGLHRHSLRSPDGTRVADAALGDELRLGLHLLAPLQRMDQTRGVETPAQVVAARVELGWRDRLESCRPGQFDRGGEKRGNYIGPNPTDKGRAGCKRPLVVDATGIPLAVRLSAANVNDCQRVAQMLDAIPALPHRGPGRPRRRPGKMHADKGYDFKKCRHACRVRGITPRIARRGIESSERLGRYRWVVERDFAWLNALRRLRTRYDRFARHYIGFLDLGRALICWNYLSKL